VGASPMGARICELVMGAADQTALVQYVISMYVVLTGEALSPPVRLQQLRGRVSVLMTLCNALGEAGRQIGSGAVGRSTASAATRDSIMRKSVEDNLGFRGQRPWRLYMNAWHPA
jgi:hypothetical protein